MFYYGSRFLSRISEMWEERSLSKELVLTEPALIASPALGDEAMIYAVMERKFYKSGKFHNHIKRLELKQVKASSVSTSQFQFCLHFTLLAKLSPDWNKVGQVLVKGKDFLLSSSKKYAIDFDLVVNETELHMIVNPCSVKLPAAHLDDFGISHSVINDFLHHKTAIIAGYDINKPRCHILPSMKKGEIIEITHELSEDSIFKTYNDMKKYWKNSYGYHLPEDQKNLFYYNIYFQLLGDQLYTCCILPYDIFHYPCCNSVEILKIFIKDFTSNFSTVCGQKIQLESSVGIQNISLKYANEILGNTEEKVNISYLFPPSYDDSFLSSTGAENLNNYNENSTHQTDDSLTYENMKISPTQISNKPVNLKNNVKIKPLFLPSKSFNSVSSKKLNTVNPPNTKIKSTLMKNAEKKVNNPIALHNTCFQKRSLENHTVNTDEAVAKIIGRTQSTKLISSLSPLRDSSNISIDKQSYNTGSAAIIQKNDSIVSNKSTNIKKTSKVRSKLMHLETKQSNSENIDVEKMFKSNQINKVRVPVLYAWLKEKGVSVQRKDKKAELVEKVIHFISLNKN